MTLLPILPRGVPLAQRMEALNAQIIRKSSVLADGLAYFLETEENRRYLDLTTSQKLSAASTLGMAGLSEIVDATKPGLLASALGAENPNHGAVITLDAVRSANNGLTAHMSKIGGYAPA